MADLADFEALRTVSKAPHALLCKLAKEIDYYPTDLEICKALNIPAPILVPACPECGAGHWHKHGEQTFDPTVQALYTPTREQVKPLTARKPENRSPRLIAAVEQIIYDWVKERAARESIPMAEIVRQAMNEIYDRGKK